MTTSEEAIRIAERYLKAEFPGHDLVVTQTIEHPIGWGIAYQYRRYLETGDESEMLIGPGPLLVLRSDGSVVRLRTFQPLEEEMRDYAKSHG